MTTYLDTIAVQRVAPRTHDGYWSKTRNWIIPNIGQHRLDRLEPEHLDAMYAVMFRKKLAPSHVLKVHRILSRALKIAVRRGKIGHNVAEMIDPPSAQCGDQDNLTQEEARQVLAAAGRRNGTRWSVALACGLRQGESIGLRWEFLDLDTGTVGSGGSSSATPGATALMIRMRAAPACTGSSRVGRPALSTSGVRHRARRAAPGTPGAAPNGTVVGWSSAGPRASPGE